MITIVAIATMIATGSPFTLGPYSLHEKGRSIIRGTFGRILLKGDPAFGLYTGGEGGVAGGGGGADLWKLPQGSHMKPALTRAAASPLRSRVPLKP